MKTTTKMAAAGAVAGIIVRQVRQSRARTPVDGTNGQPGNRWRAVTVNKQVSEVAPGGTLPQPLAALGESVEVRIEPAPGGKGTEIAARLRSSEPSGPGALTTRLTGDDPRQAIRSALRQSKQLLEVGEVLRTGPQPAGHRPATPAGKTFDALTRRAGSEGVL